MISDITFMRWFVCSTLYQLMALLSLTLITMLELLYLLIIVHMCRSVLNFFLIHPVCIPKSVLDLFLTHSVYRGLSFIYF